MNKVDVYYRALKNYRAETLNVKECVKDRNLITHTYKEDIAEEISLRIKFKYIEILEEFIEDFDKRMKN